MGRMKVKAAITVDLSRSPLRLCQIYYVLIMIATDILTDMAGECLQSPLRLMTLDGGGGAFTFSRIIDEWFVIRPRHIRKMTVAPRPDCVINWVRFHRRHYCGCVSISVSVTSWFLHSRIGFPFFANSAIPFLWIETDARFRLTEDLLESEREFMISLRTIYDVYARPLRKLCSISDEEQRQLFGGVEPVLSVSNMLLTKVWIHLKLLFVFM